MKKHIKKLEDLVSKCRPWIEDYRQIYSDIATYLERLRKGYYKSKDNKRIEEEINELEGKLNAVILVREKMWDELEREKKELGVK